jgi:hypothetical protein
MARGGRKTPPPPNRTPIVTRSRSQDNIPPQTATTSTEDPHITVEPATPNPTGGDIQEIFRQSLIKSHKAFASLRQPHRPWSQPLDFSEVRDQLGDIDTTVNPTDSNPVAGGSGIPPSPPPSPLHLLLLQRETPLRTKAIHLRALLHLLPQWLIRTTLLDLG